MFLATYINSMLLLNFNRSRDQVSFSKKTFRPRGPSSLRSIYQNWRRHMWPKGLPRERKLIFAMIKVQSCSAGLHCIDQNFKICVCKNSPNHGSNPALHTSKNYVLVQCMYINIICVCVSVMLAYSLIVIVDWIVFIILSFIRGVYYN